MNKLIILLAVIITACNSPANTGEKNKEASPEHHATVTLQLNNGSKWKADTATRQNVAAMVKVVNDTAYAKGQQHMQLYARLQTTIDTLVKQCSMQGADHEALHVWLEKVLEDMKEIKEKKEEPAEAYAALKSDVESFYTFFE